MALLHQAELVPTKLQLVEQWAPSQPWFAGEGDYRTVGSYRFDDPAGEVGVETLLVRVGEGPVLQVPLTYRDAPLDGAQDWLIGTMEHSVLGKRWTYDAAGDPVYLAALATAALTGGSQAEQWIEIDGEMVERQPSARVHGSGTDVDTSVTLPTSVSTQSDARATYIDTERYRIRVARVLDPAEPLDADGATLTGDWTDSPESAVLAVVALL